MIDEKNETTPPEGEDLAALFHRAARMMARAYHRGSHAQHAQDRVFSLVRERGPLRQGDLLEILDVRSSSLSEVLGKLEAADLIVRERDPADRRGFILSARQDARPAFWDRPDGHREDARALFAGLDDAERQELGRLLGKVIRSLEDGGPGQETWWGRPGRGLHHRGCCVGRGRRRSGR